MGHRWIAEHHIVKVLLEPQGAIFALTTTVYSYLFFVTREFVGFKRIRTADRIVARARYSAPGALRLIAQLYPNGA